MNILRSSFNVDHESAIYSLHQMEKEIDEKSQEELPQKGLFALKFMQRAVQRKREEAKVSLQQIRRELENDDQDSQENILAGNEESFQSGRLVFSGNLKSDQKKPDQNSSDLVSTLDSSSASTKQVSLTKTTIATEKIPNKKSRKLYESEVVEKKQEDEQEENPWMENSNNSGKNIIRSKKDTSNTGSSSANSKLQKSMEKIAKIEKLKIQENFTDSLNHVQEDILLNPNSLSLAKKLDNSSSFSLENNTTDIQQQLVAEAFANDQVVEEAFLQEKDEMISKENDIVLEGDQKKTIPGWGTWVGEGVKVSQAQKRRLELEIVENENKKKTNLEMMKKARKDSSLQFVIINEKRDKRFAEKLVKSVPFPFVNREVYERNLQRPLGKEWNSVSSCDKLIQPKVAVKAGKIIHPIQRVKSNLKGKQ
eukprot:Sdes_comp20777_c0_seq2m16829